VSSEQIWPAWLMIQQFSAFWWFIAVQLFE